LWSRLPGRLRKSPVAGSSLTQRQISDVISGRARSELGSGTRHRTVASTAPSGCARTSPTLRLWCGPSRDRGTRTQSGDPPLGSWPHGLRRPSTRRPLPRNLGTARRPGHTRSRYGARVTLGGETWAARASPLTHRPILSTPPGSGLPTAPTPTLPPNPTASGSADTVQDPRPHTGRSDTLAIPVRAVKRGFSDAPSRARPA
jgi:hypothetical protein